MKHVALAFIYSQHLRKVHLIRKCHAYTGITTELSLTQNPYNAMAKEISKEIGKHVHIDNLYRYAYMVKHSEQEIVHVFRLNLDRNPDLTVPLEFDILRGCQDLVMENEQRWILPLLLTHNDKMPIVIQIDDLAQLQELTGDFHEYKVSKSHELVPV